VVNLEKFETFFSKICPPLFKHKIKKKKKKKALGTNFSKKHLFIYFFNRILLISLYYS